MTRGQLKLRVSRIIGFGLGTSDDAIDEAQLLEELANEAVLDILQRTRLHVRKAEIMLDADDTEFEVDDVILRFFRLQRGEDGPFMDEQPAHQLGSNGFAFVGFNRFVVGTAGGGTGDNLICWYTPKPSPMTDDNHDPAMEQYGNIPSQFHRAILDYMCWHTADKAGDMQAGRGEVYRIRYEGQDALGSVGSDLGRIKLYTNVRAGRMRTKRHRESLTSDRDSAYWTG